VPEIRHIFRQGRGVYLPITARGRLKELLRNWPEPDVRFIVVTDGERILGLGDLGAGGMGIPIGKLALCTALAGVPPQHCLPVVLDVGTNNESLLEDSLYLGLRQHRLRGDEYMSFVNEFVATVQDLWPRCCVQWEDFANFNAVPILARYQDKICTFNDDIQGTAGTALAGLTGALRITGQKLADQRFLFLGAGSAATGIAELISLAMAREGVDLKAARHRNVLFDVNGLVVSSRADLADFQKPFCAGPRSDRDLPRSRRGRATDRHHRRQCRAEIVHPGSDRGDGEDQRPSDHFPVLQPDLALRMHGRGSVSLVGGPGGVRQRQPISAR
jgi:malate dehydrogenase (oxaloacetate-decarboxylating)(NADP+)